MRTRQEPRQGVFLACRLFKFRRLVDVVAGGPPPTPYSGTLATTTQKLNIYLQLFTIIVVIVTFLPLVLRDRLVER